MLQRLSWSLNSAGHLRLFHHTAARYAKSVSKKKFADLPQFYELPDGSIATPLADFRLPQSNVLAENETRQTQLPSQEPEPAKRTRTRKPKPELTESTTVEKKRRKTKASDVGLSLEDPPPVKRTRPKAESPQIAPPRNFLAGEILENLAKFPNCILLTRVGGFYESYFEQAIEVARLLNIKEASRKWDGRRVPMCGFPIMHLEKYLQKLVQESKRFVAMCEEFPVIDEFGARQITRRVTRVITPGTLVDESFITENENNFLLSISCPSDMEEVRDDTLVGLAWIDVSTGEFFSKSSSYGNIRDDLVRISAQEVVLESWLEKDSLHPIRHVFIEENSLVSYIDLPSTNPVLTGNTTPNFSGNIHQPSASDDMTDLVLEPTSSSDVAFTPQETSAIALLTEYMKHRLLEHMPLLSLPNRESFDRRMQIDAHTIKALEIKESLREGGVRGTLLNVVKRTKTSSGSRLLSRWLCSPSTSMAEINARQSLVALLHARPHFRADLLSTISNVDDASRIVQKFTLGRGEAADLFAINKTIQFWSSVKSRIAKERRMEKQERPGFSDTEWESLDLLMSQMVDLQDLSALIHAALQKRETSVQEEPLETQDTLALGEAESSTAGWKYGNNKWFIKPDFSPTLQTLHDLLVKLLQKRQNLELQLQHRFAAPSLTLRSSPGLGMHVHLGKALRQQAGIKSDSSFISIAESRTTKCYFYQEWAHLGGEILSTTLNLIKAEKEAFDILRARVISHASQLKRNARILDELDVTLAFANLAEEMNYVRPIMTEDTCYEVTGSRHATVELGLMMSGRVFTPNSVSLTPKAQLHVLSAPNMAGKSTLLRQTALIAILAQTGSFIPADSGKIGIVDKVFSRVGASDDLFRDRSTFMVEMLETATILQRATPRSLVIMDEVGRGTTAKDGLAIAFATLHHLVSVNQCRTLFATHFHELADMLGYSEVNHTGSGPFENVAFYCTDVDETNSGNFAYSYQVRPGVNRKSHGLKVAQLAGMPKSVITVAQNALLGIQSRLGNDSEDLALVSKEALIGYTTP